MAPTLFPRDSAIDEEGEGVHGRTRIDDTDPQISFFPAPSPYSPQHSAHFTVVNDPSAYNGTAVKTREQDARISFSFPGDSLTIGFLYNSLGSSAKLTLENGTEFPFQIPAGEAPASVPNSDKPLQKKLFRINGLACTNHTATLTPGPPLDGSAAGRDESSRASMYFDWFSFVSPDSPTFCLAKDAQLASSSQSATKKNGSPVQHSHYKTMEYAGIGVGAAILAVLSSILAYVLWSRKRRHSEQHADQVVGDQRFQGFQDFQDCNMTSSMPPNMTHRSQEPLLEPDPAYRPRGIHALVHNESFSSAQTENRPSIVDSPSANTIFPLLPASSRESLTRADDVGYCIGRTLLELQHEPAGHFRNEMRYSGSRLHYQKARMVSGTPPKRFFPSHEAPALIGSHALQRMPKDDPRFSNPHLGAQGGARNKTLAPSSYQRPRTASAVEQLRTEARQLDVHRPLSPFNRSRPTTSSGTFNHRQPLAVEKRLATAPTESANHQMFRRCSSTSIDTHWSHASANGSFIEPQPVSQLAAMKNLLQVPDAVAAEGKKTTDSEAEMWISKRKSIAPLSSGKRQRHSTCEPPRRPPKSPHRPSTGQAAPPAMSNQPFSIS